MGWYNKMSRKFVKYENEKILFDTNVSYSKKKINSFLWNICRYNYRNRRDFVEVKFFNVLMLRTASP